MEKTNQTKFSLADQVRIFKGIVGFGKPHWLPFTLSFVATAVVAGISAYLPIVIQRYLDQVLATNSATLPVTIQVAAFYFGLTLLKVAVYYFRDFTFKLTAEKSVADMRNTLYKKVVHLGMRYFDQIPNGSVVSRVTNDTETIKEFWQVFLSFFDGLLNIVAITYAMFTLDAGLALVFMAFVPVMLVLIYIYQRQSTYVYGRMRVALSTLNAKLSESISGMNIIQNYGQQDRLIQEFDDVNQTYVRARVGMFKMNALLLQPAINLLEAIALVLVLYIFGFQDLQGVAINVGVVYAFTSYAKSFFQPMGQMMDSLSIFQDGMVSGSRVLDLLNSQEMAPVSNKDASGKVTDGHIQIKGLSFSYDGKKQVLHDINIDIQPGQTVAFVGQTGSGKSSIINVLMRFYEFNQGEILIDGQSIKDIPVTQLREDIGLVLQDSFMFYGNIADNIRLHGDYSIDMVKAATQFVKADAFIESLEDGYHAKVIEGGAAFSTGQKQLLSFARSILREPKILVLDEATANIDTETEQKIQSGLSNMRLGRTTIIIAHRLSTIKYADQIIVLKNGQIIEHGNHDDLIGQGGTYYNMYQLQTYSDAHQDLGEGETDDL
ncbi:multidrug ABC transporter ATP-binding protein [Aerococcus viridans]|uniref:Multidrug ABC transporter ATP-binding protein n=1 Tax=Aerococcus viridans TaxID=1377 RepID=A0A2N6UFT5_9LACT|nr:ABC transporter ATP-binding protein [Aerococcus viridans]PMC80417.1 multidrug ABC transporter ATP-binding protein [Aerococcus viridans]